MTTQNKIEKMEIENNLDIEIRNDILIVTNKETFEESRFEIESQTYEERMLEVLAFVEGLVNNVTKEDIRINTELEEKLADMVLSSFIGLTKCWVNERSGEFDNYISIEIQTEYLPMSVEVVNDNGEIKIQTTSCGKVNEKELTAIFNAQRTLITILFTATKVN